MPDSNPLPITINLVSAEKSLLAKCVPSQGQGERPDRWELIVPIGEVGPEDRKKGKGGKKYEIVREKVRSEMRDLEAGTYQMSVPWLKLPGSIPGLDSKSDAMQSVPTFQWKRQEHEGAAPTTFSKPDWKLINVAAGEVHAVLIERWEAVERGEMQFRRSFGRQWELSVVLSVGVVIEESRRGNSTQGFVRAAAGQSI